MPGDRISKTELDVDGRKLVKVPSVKGLIDIGKANVKFVLQLQVKGGAVDPPTQKNVEGVIDKMLDEFGRKINDELEELVKQVKKKQEDEKRGDDKAADEAMSLVEKTNARIEDIADDFRNDLREKVEKKWKTLAARSPSLDLHDTMTFGLCRIEEAKIVRGAFTHGKGGLSAKDAKKWEEVTGDIGELGEHVGGRHLTAESDTRASVGDACSKHFVAKEKRGDATVTLREATAACDGYTEHADEFIDLVDKALDRELQKFEKHLKTEKDLKQGVKMGAAVKNLRRDRLALIAKLKETRSTIDSVKKSIKAGVDDAAKRALTGFGGSKGAIAKLCADIKSEAQALAKLGDQVLKDAKKAG